MKSNLIFLLAIFTHAAARADMAISVVSGPPTGSSVKISYTLQGTTGTTSLRFYPPRVGDPDKFDDTATGGSNVEFIFNPPFGAPDSALSKPKVRYFIRDRDLGQTFTIGTAPMRMDAITLRTGPSDNAVRTGALGARVFMQFYKVTGTPVINDHGTTAPDGSGDNRYTRWATCCPHDPKSDDYIDGETLTPLMTVEGNLPSNPATFVKNTYFRIEFSGNERPVFEANSVYAWVLGFVEPGDPDKPDEPRAMSLANEFHPNAPAKDYPGGHGLRRDGSTLDLEATFVRLMDVVPPGTTPEQIAADVEASRQAAQFPYDLTARQALTPGTFGFPDVEGHRDFRMYIEGTVAPPQLTTAVGNGADTFIDSSAPTTSQASTNRMRIRKDASTESSPTYRKSYLRFDLASVTPSGSAIDGAELALTVTNTDSALANPFTVNVYGLNNGDAGEGWAETINWNSGAPAHNGTHPVTSAATLLGSFTINGGSVSAGQKIVVNHTQLAGLLPFLQADTDKRVTFILAYETTTGKSLDFSTKNNTTYGGAGLTIAPVVGAGAAQTITLPSTASLSGSVDGDVLLATGTSVTWSATSGPGTVGFSNPTALATSANFSQPGNYMLSLSATRGNLTRTAQIAVTVRDSFAEWSGRVFPVDTPAADKLASADPEKDNLTNRLEYAFLSDPLADSSKHAPTVGIEAGFVTLTYRKNLLASELIYKVLESGSLSGWMPATTTDEMVSDDGILRVIKAKVARGNATEKFLRLEVTEAAEP